MEAAYRLDRENPRFLIGLTRSPKGANDPLLQVVGDLYQRWLADARAWEQLKTVWEQQKDTLLPAFARFVGKLSEKAGKIIPVVGELGGTAIRESLEGLVAATEDLRGGRLIVSRLEYSQAQELVASVQQIAGQRVTLVMDQWEETGDLDQQGNTFRDFLREPEQWPDCHILLGAREGGVAAELLRELEREFPASAYAHTLGEIDLTAETERRRLVTFLHAQPQLRALENIDDNQLLNLVGGYPGVIYRWLEGDACETVGTVDGLRRLAREANEFRYRDLEKLLLGLDGDRRKLAVRIALVPLVEDANVWQVLRRVLLADLDLSSVDDLKDNNVLDRQTEVPSFGHRTRRDAAGALLRARRRETVRAEAEGLTFSFARSVSKEIILGVKPGASVIPYAAALVGLRDEVRQQNLRPLAFALCEAAMSLFRENLPSLDLLIEGAREARRLPEPGVGLLLAIALCNALFDVKAEDDLARLDALFDELRALARSYPDDAAVRQYLAWGTFNALLKIKAEDDLVRRDELLGELGELARGYPDDPAVREVLARGLSESTLFGVRVEDDLVHRDALLDRLRGLARSYPDDAAVRQYLANGLCFMVLDSKAENDLVRQRAKNDLARRDTLLDELRTLARGYPDDAAVRRALANGVFNTLFELEAEDDLVRKALLDELRALAHGYPDDPDPRELLARGLIVTLIDVIGDRHVRHDALRDELAALARSHPDDAAVRELLARGLSTMFDVKAEDDRVRRNVLLDQLRALARSYPDDAAVRQHLAESLSALFGIESENDLVRRNTLLEELRALARDYPNDATVRELLLKLC
jgi:hypothetical protein